MLSPLPTIANQQRVSSSTMRLADRCLVGCVGRDLQVGLMEPPHRPLRELAGPVKRQPGVSSEQRRKILWENCARLYAIEPPSGSSAPTAGGRTTSDARSCGR